VIETQSLEACFTEVTSCLLNSKKVNSLAAVRGLVIPFRTLKHGSCNYEMLNLFCKNSQTSYPVTPLTYKSKHKIKSVTANRDKLTTSRA